MARCINARKSSRIKPLPSVHLLGAGTPMCAGCGGLEAVQEIYDILDAKTLPANKPSLLKLTETLMI